MSAITAQTDETADDWETKLINRQPHKQSTIWLAGRSINVLSHILLISSSWHGKRPLQGNLSYNSSIFWAFSTLELEPCGKTVCLEYEVLFNLYSRRMFWYVKILHRSFFNSLEVGTGRKIACQFFTKPLPHLNCLKESMIIFIYFMILYASSIFYVWKWVIAFAVWCNKLETFKTMRITFIIHRVHFLEFAGNYFGFNEYIVC